MSNRIGASELLEQYKLDPSDVEISTKVLGRGAFASAFLGRRRSDNKRVVIKKVEHFATSQQRLAAKHELLAMATAGPHVNVVSFLGWFEEGQDDPPCIVLGYCQGGTLYQLLRGPEAQQGPDQPEVLFTEAQIMSWFLQLLLGLDHLHQQHVMHRDIKPQNIFLSRTKQFVKLGDLGVSAVLNSSSDLRSTVTGSPLYMGPELMSGVPYSLSSDIWSLGCVLYESAARRTAFDACGLPQLVAKVVNNLWQPLPSVYSSPFRQLVASMLRPDPAERPTTRRLLSLPYVKKHLEFFARKYSNRVPASQLPLDMVLPAGPAGLEARGRGARKDRGGIDESLDIKVLEKGRPPTAATAAAPGPPASRPSTANHAKNWASLGAAQEGGIPANGAPPPPSPTTAAAMAAAGRAKNAWGSPSRAGARGEGQPSTSTSTGGADAAGARAARGAAGLARKSSGAAAAARDRPSTGVVRSVQSPREMRPGTAAAPPPRLAATARANSIKKDAAEVAPSRRIRPRANTGATNLGSLPPAPSAPGSQSKALPSAAAPSYPSPTHHEEEPRVGGPAPARPPATPAGADAAAGMGKKPLSRAGSKQRGSGSSLQTMTMHAKPRVWEPAVGYVQEQKEAAQRRFQALQLSMRRTREEVRQKKKGNAGDPMQTREGGASRFGGLPAYDPERSQGLIHRFANHDLVVHPVPLLQRGEPLDPIESVSWVPSSSVGDDSVVSGEARAGANILDYISPSSTLMGYTSESSQANLADPHPLPRPSDPSSRQQLLLDPSTLSAAYLSPRYARDRADSLLDDPEYPSLGLPPIQQESSDAFYRYDEDEQRLLGIGSPSRGAVEHGHGHEGLEDEDVYEEDAYEDDDFDELESDADDADDAYRSGAADPSFDRPNRESEPEVLLLSLSGSKKAAALASAHERTTASGRTRYAGESEEDEDEDDAAAARFNSEDESDGGASPRPETMEGPQRYGDPTADGLLLAAAAGAQARSPGPATELLTELQRVWDSDPSVRFALLRELWNMSLVDSLGGAPDLDPALLLGIHSHAAAAAAANANGPSLSETHGSACTSSTQDFPTLSEFVVAAAAAGSSPVSLPARPGTAAAAASEPPDAFQLGDGAWAARPQTAAPALSGFAFQPPVSVPLELDPASESEADLVAQPEGHRVPFGPFAIPPPSTDLAASAFRAPSTPPSRRTSDSHGHSYASFEDEHAQSALLPGSTGAVTPKLASGGLYAADAPLPPHLRIGSSRSSSCSSTPQPRYSLPTPTAMAGGDQGYLALLRDLKALKRANTELGLNISFQSHTPDGGGDAQAQRPGTAAGSGNENDVTGAAGVGVAVVPGPHASASFKSSSSVRSSWGPIADPSSFAVSEEHSDSDLVEEDEMEEAQAQASPVQIFHSADSSPAKAASAAVSPYARQRISGSGSGASSGVRSARVSASGSSTGGGTPRTSLSGAPGTPRSAKAPVRMMGGGGSGGMRSARASASAASGSLSGLRVGSASIRSGSASRRTSAH